MMDVLSIREHSSTDGMPEYRVLIDPSALADRAASGVRGIRPPIDVPSASEDGGDEEVEDDEAAADDNDTALERLETAAQSKAKKRTKRTQSAPVSPTASLRLWLPAVMVRAVVPGLVDAYETKAQRRAEKKARKRTKESGTEKAGAQSKVTTVNTANASSTVHHATTASKSTRFASKGRRKPKGAAEAQDEGYEYINLSDASTCSEDEPVQAKGRSRTTARAKTIKRHPEPRPTVEDSFPPTSPVVAERVTCRPNLRPPSYDKSEEDYPLAKPSLPAKSACIRPLEVLRRRTNAKSKDSTKPPAVQAEGVESASTQCISSPTCVPRPVAPAQKPIVARKPRLYIDVSSDEVEIAEVRTTVAVNAPVVKESRTQVAVTDFFSVSKGRTGPKASSKLATPIKLAHISLLSDTLEHEDPSGTSWSTCTSPATSKGRPLTPRPFPMPPPVITPSDLQDRQKTPPNTDIFGAPRSSDSLTGVCHESLLPKGSDTVEVLSDSETPPKAKSLRTSPAHRSPHAREPRSARDLGTPSSPTLLVTRLPPEDSLSSPHAEEPASRRLLNPAPSSSTTQIPTGNVLNDVIWISSGSEDEDNTDEIGGGDADVAMILSAPPVLSEPESEPPPPCVRTSKFRPGGAPGTVAAGSKKGKVDLGLDRMSKDVAVNGSETKETEQVRRVREPPLLLARAKRSASKATSVATTSTRITSGMRPSSSALDDIIDLT